MDLDGVRVLDLTRLLPGPYASQLLADQGADVIKIEEPNLGDYARYMEPMVDGTGLFFSAVNRGKKSVTLDLSEDRGRDVFFRLTEDADVVFESFSAGTAERMGIGFDQVREHNDRIVYCSLSGYGQTGPYSDRPGHDLNYSGYTGLLDMTRSDPDDQPTITGFPISDMSGGLMAAFRIVSALAARELGNDDAQYLDVSLTEATLSFSQAITPLALAGETPRPGETVLTGKYPCYDIYEAADGKYVTLAALEPKFWETFCEEVDRPDLIDKHLSEEADVRDEVRGEVESIFAQKPRDYWDSELGDAGAMVASVHEPTDVVDDPHFNARDLFPEGEYRVGLHGDVSADKESWPDKGEHTELILNDSGLSENEIARLADEGII